MTQEDLYKNLKSFNFPVAYDHFIVDDDNPPPSLPFITYRFIEDNDLIADNTNYFEIGVYHIELYTEFKEPEKERLLQDKFKELKIPYRKTETYIETEKMYQILYEIQI
ncbi:hypothetical protein [Clostridium cellulovorans]|uniref:Phage related protein n=1 Tax=Clostridium cellulovorans (strain ATCC 35296 / DSM 3052 / OCM 3 / 743B) TaxID=573061 RepID=D9SQ09_CLOC7|nr:hypothetical protein [Clostridium cellulovorans]ADL52145.1 phage related protein [Clostridium cellulovorans 743B]